MMLAMEYGERVRFSRELFVYPLSFTSMVEGSRSNVC